MRKFIVLVLTLSIIFATTVEARKKGRKGLKPTLSNVVRLVVDGDFRRAGKMLKKIEKRLRNLGEAESKFILGYVKFKMGKYKGAKAQFEGVSVELPQISDHVKYFYGASCLEIGDYQCAIKNFSDVGSGSVWRMDARWGLVQAYYGVGEYDQALSVLSKLEPDISVGLTDSEYNLFKAKILAKLGRKGEAVRLLDGVYFSGDSKAVRSKAMRGLKEIGTHEAGAAIDNINSVPGQVRLAEQLMRNYHYDEGLAILEKFYNRKGDQHSTELLAGAYFKARNYKKAKELYKKLVDSKKGKGTYYLLKLAQSASRTNDFELAIKCYKKLLRGTGGGTRTKYLYKLGFLYLDANQYEKALGPFLELLDSNYRGSLREKISWNLAWSYYKLGQYENAITYFEKYKEGGFGKTAKARAIYWIARVNEKLGRKSAAKSLYSDLIFKNRLGYYGFLAFKRINGKGRMPSDWISFSEVKNPVGNDTSLTSAELSKAKYLSDLGLHDLAAKELRQFNGKKVPRGNAAVAFMEFARLNGDYRTAHLASIWNFKPLLHQFPKNEDFRRFVWEGWYPDAYSPIVKRYAKKFDVDENLAYSIMREESRFQTGVVSKADAIGLMQIIPSTAMRLAKELKHNPFELKQMFEPQVNVKFGIQYLNDLLRMFDSEKVYVIASYNAGEEAVSRWKKDSDAEDIEEFVEEIPYAETNKYVKRVLKSYWIYDELY